MNYAQINQRYFCGIDLHANSMYLKILNREGQVLYKRNMPNNCALFKKILAPFLPDIAVGVESTFNYYWLYDGCVESDIPFYLGHAAYMKAIAGNKQKNDPLDAETIAHLMRSNLFPQAYPYPGEECRIMHLIAGLSVYKELPPAKTSTAKNQKMGNPYLKWTYGQILTHARQSSERINAYYQKLEAKRCGKLAGGIISHKFAVAVYHMLKKKVAFSEDRFLKVAS
jgi:hypothetical protein